jgi:hypothetical protein
MQSAGPTSTSSRDQSESPLRRDVVGFAALGRAVGPVVRRLGRIDVLTVKPLAVIGVGLGATGTAKLAGAKVTKERFDRWGYPAWSRIVMGAFEVGIAAAAISALRDPQARPVAAFGTLCSMTGAIATHARAGDSALNYVPAIGLAAAAVATLAGR